MTGPGLITTRKQSRIIEENQSLVNQLKARKKRYEEKLAKVIEQINSNEAKTWTKGQVSERQMHLNQLAAQLEKVHDEVLIDLDVESQSEFTEDDTLNNGISAAKAKLLDLLDAFPKAEQSKIEPFPIEVIQTDGKGNIPNLWGKFDGDYSKWRTFHDKWVATMHNEAKVKNIIKLQNLMAACVGSAKGALGEWEITDDSYEKAWLRLCTIYEDDYMQVESFMQKLLVKLPPISGSSSKTIRDTIDIVQKHIHGIKRYKIDSNENHPYVVFAIIGKMDADTYRAWEKHRPSLAKANAEKNGEDAHNARPGKYIPTWKELELFLENEVTIRVHAERHASDEKAQQNATNTSKRSSNRFNKQNRFRAKSNSKNDKTYTSESCVICDGSHMIYHCPSFLDMNLIGRQNQVAEHELCVRCLRKIHTGECANKKSNNECPKCLPEKKFHNNKLCPNAYNTNAAMKASSSLGKRKKEDDKQHIPKKKRHFNNGQKQKKDGNQAVANKVQEWSLVAKQSNAMQNIKLPKECKFESTILVATMNIRIEDKINSLIILCRGISDTGATLNCIAAYFVEENMLATIKCQKRILGVTGPEIIKRKIKATVRPWFKSEFKIETEFFVIKQLDGLYPDRQINVNKEQIMHLELADENFDKPAPINAILGAEIYAQIIGTDLYKHKDGAIMQSTELGHIILGKFNVKKYESNLPILSLSEEHNDVKFSHNKDEQLEKNLSNFWELEEVDKIENNALMNSEQSMVEELFKKTHYREASGRYVVTIPLKPHCKHLGESKRAAKAQFMQLERKFRRDPQLKSKYVEYMQENKRLGYMQIANKPKPDELCYWLPHHAVTKKFRVVLNGSNPTSNGESLNSIQMKGPKLQYDVQLQTMRFRRHKHAVATDITKMFNRIGLNKSQWNMHRLFWRENENDPLEEYVMTVIIFGGTSSAYNAVRTMNQCADDYATIYPQASEIIKKSFYMDDGIFGCDNENELKILCKEVEFVLGQGHFMLKGWVSNSEKTERYLNACTSNEIEIGEKDEEKVLGLRWLKTTDELSIVVKLEETKRNFTKRSILSEIARLYDPNGFIAPIIVRAKMLMQKIWRLKDLTWDKDVPPEISTEWLNIYAELPLLSKFKVKRWLGINKDSKIQIHGFCDASEKAYGICIYVRIINKDNEICCSLLSAKSKVAPLKEMTIPRLELLGALMLSEQMNTVLKACEFNDADATCWTDSMIVLNWIKKQPSELKAFVANRVQKIQDLAKHFKWKHVRSGDNSADLVSRGMKMQDFLTSNLWLEGPSWLKQNEQQWPIPKLSITPEAQNEITKECKPKATKEKILNIIAGTENTILYNKFQSWDKVLNVTAYILRVYLKAKHQYHLIGSKYIRPIERRNSIEFWVKYEQSIAFKKELKCIKAGDTLPAKSSLAALRPMLDSNGILRVGGRIDKANLAYESKHQYIIPHKSRLSFLIVKHAHEATMHGGAQLMTQFIRRQFWIPKIRLETRCYVKSCVQCVRLAQQSVEQIMAELPEIRLRPAPPFQHVGVDMAGPYLMRVSEKINANTRSRSMPDMKGWVAVFVCLVTRAIHLEAVEGMSAEDFLVAYQKFTNRRGNPEKIWSDNGTNFRGADSNLKKALESWKNDETQRYVHLKGTEWHYIKPSAPHEGGIWEAAVKQMKHHLKRVIGVQKYSFQGITALLTGVEACLNSRPICKMSDDPEDQEPLTPAHFLIGRPLRLPIHEKSDTPPYSIKRLYLQLQFQIQAFWKQWSNDYLQSLTQLPKWRTEHENMKVGQLVIIKADNIAPTYWAMGRILQINKASDGKVRSVLLKTQSGELERSIRKICVLPSDIELSYWKQIE